MKATIIETKKAKQETIDWSKSQLLIDDEGIIVLTDGCHVKDKFSATVLFDSGKDYESGQYDNNWYKEQFSILPNNQQVILQND